MAATCWRERDRLNARGLDRGRALRIRSFRFDHLPHIQIVFGGCCRYPGGPSSLLERSTWRARPASARAPDERPNETFTIFFLEHHGAITIFVLAFVALTRSRSAGPPSPASRGEDSRFLSPLRERAG